MRYLLLYESRIPVLFALSILLLLILECIIVKLKRVSFYIKLIFIYTWFTLQIVIAGQNTSFKEAVGSAMVVRGFCYKYTSLIFILFTIRKLLIMQYNVPPESQKNFYRGQNILHKYYKR